MLALMVGVVMIVAGVAGLGFVADLLSKPTQIGYMNGLALTILVGQLPKLFGFSVDADGLIGETPGVRPRGGRRRGGAGRGRGRARGLVLILVLQRWLPKVPAVLVAVVAGDRGANVFDLGDARRRAGRACCRRASRRSPSRRVGWSDVGPLLAGALGDRAGRRWPTPSRPRRRSPPAPARRCTATRR